MTRFVRSAFCFGALFLAGTSAPAAMINVFSTGTTANGALAAGGSVDAHYSIISGPAGANPAIVATTLPGVYTPNTSNSQWIGLSANLNSNYPQGAYDFRTTFSLAGLDASTAQISGSIAADDNVTILINGTATAYTNFGSLNSLSAFSLTSGFVAGTNTIDFIVNNVPASSTPMGLQVNVTSATANAVVPEPASILLVGLGGVAALGLNRRRRATA